MAGPDFLDEHRGRAHGEDIDGEDIVRDVVGVENFDIRALAQLLFQHQAADIGIAAAAGAEDRRTTNEIVQIVAREFHARSPLLSFVVPLMARSPTALTRIRTAPAGM